MSTKSRSSKSPKSARNANPAPKARKSAKGAAEPKVDALVEIPAEVATTPTTDANTANTSNTAGTKAKKVREPKAPKQPKVKKTSGLDAAAQVLADKGEPMNCKDIVDTMLAQGLWQTNGKTPHATIYSAMLREIDAKPGESRFTKTGRGLFALATPATTKKA